MAVLNIDLLQNSHVVISESNADETNTVNITALGSSHLTVDGVIVSIESLAGVAAGSSPTFEAINGGVLTIDQGLLAVGAISSTTYQVGDESTIHLEASTLDLGAVSSLLGVTQTVEFTGQNNTGMFVYDPPQISILSGAPPMTFSTEGMQATDMFVVEGKTLSLDTTLFGGQSSAYRDGELHLETGGGLLTPKVHVSVPMTAAEFNLFITDIDIYLVNGTFIFPGTIVCFARGTLIQTKCGQVPIEDICAGDQVSTRDHGNQIVRWIGSRRVGAITFEAQPKLRPIRICAGALGQNIPTSDLIVSPQHRVLVRSKIARRMFDATEVLVAAKHLIHLDGIQISEDLDGIEYFHMLFDQHEIVFSNGAETESLFTGPEALKAVSRQARQEIFTLFPELQKVNYTPVPARVLVSGRLGRKLAFRHEKNNRTLLM